MSMLRFPALRMTRLRVSISLALAGALFALLALAGPPKALAACSNEAIREQQGIAAYVPGCRGYEMVTPGPKNGNEVDSPGFTSGLDIPFQAALSGPNIALEFIGGIPGGETAGELVAWIGTGGAPSTPWGLASLAPTNRFGQLHTIGPIQYGPVDYYSPDLHCAVEQTKLAQPRPGTNEPLLAPGETPDDNVDNIYVWENGNWTLVTVSRPRAPEKVTTTDLELFVNGASDDCRHVLFEEFAKAGFYEYEVELAPGVKGFAPPHSLYEWTAGTGASDGHLALASVLPDGKPAKNLVPLKHGEENGSLHAMSTDGKRVYFSASSDAGKPEEAGPKQVFLHEAGQPTIQVSASTTEEPDRGAKFYGASADGNLVLFTANYGLTTHASNGKEVETPNSCKIAHEGAGDGCDLYQYEVSTHTLRDLSADEEAVTGDTKGANVRGVLGTSEDGSYVYFSAAGRLVAGKGNSGADNITKKEANVYAYHEGQLTYVTTINESDVGGAAAQKPEEELDTIAAGNNHGMHYMASRVSENGGYLLFATRKKLTSYENIDVKPPGTIKDMEIYRYRYEPAGGEVTCVSCDPRNLPPNNLEPATPFGPAGLFIQLAQAVVPRNLLNDGRVFFTNYSIVAEATSPTLHVYEWHPAGFEGCVPAATGAAFNNGCVHLLDSGKGPFPNYFEGASADGQHVYITTSDRLIEEDPDGLRDVYDVRLGGGKLFAPDPLGCEANGVECQGLEGGRLDTSKRSSENPGEGNPALPGRAGTGEVESFITAKVAIKKRSHRGSTITLVIAAPGKGRITASGAGVRTAGRSVGALGNYTVKLTLGKKAKSAVKHHKKVKVRLHISFRPANGKASSVNVTVTV